MTALAAFAGSYLLNSAWQVPLIFAAAWAAARAIRSMGPRAEHRVWVAALMLETVVPAWSLSLGDLWRAVRLLLPALSAVDAAGGQVKVAVARSVALGTGILRLPPALLATLLMVYAGSLLYFSARLAWGAWRTDRMRRRAQPLVPGATAAEVWERCCTALGKGSPREVPGLATSSTVSGPVTVGIRRSVLLLPPSFLDGLRDDDLEAVLAHEFAHVLRRDFAKNLFYGVVSLPVAWHPLLWLTRARVAGSREIICDTMAAQAVAGRERYVRSLLRLAWMLSGRSPADALHAIGIFDANILERRVMNLTRKHVEINGVRRALLAAVCVVAGLATCASALALRVEVAATDSKKTDHASPPLKVNDGTILTRVAPVYPVEAKANKDTLDGAVVLQVLVGKDGVPEQIRVTKSLRGDYDRSALDAVRQWRWQPYVLNGEPVEVTPA